MKLVVDYYAYYVWTWPAPAHKTEGGAWFLVDCQFES